jgi:signal transduction histidine kinase
MMRLSVTAMGRAIGLAAAVILMFAGAASAETLKPTKPEVEALTVRAAEVIEARGIDAAREVFNAEGEFKFGEIYVNVIDFTGTWLVYPPRPASVGYKVVNLKDPDGKSLVRDILKVAQDSGQGWVSYRWLNPVSNRIEPKSSFVKRVAGKELVAYIGVYE